MAAAYFELPDFSLLRHDVDVYAMLMRADADVYACRCYYFIFAMPLTSVPDAAPAIDKDKRCPAYYASAADVCCRFARKDI